MSDETQSLKSRLAKFIEDVATLDVITLSGSIALDNTVTEASGEENGEDALNWDKLFEKITAGMVPSADNKLEVVAYTHAEWDCDSVNYVASDISEEDQHLIETHAKTVEAAHRNRYEALQFIGKALSNLRG